MTALHHELPWPGDLAGTVVGSLDPDIERDLSAMLFFFEAYMRPGVLARLTNSAIQGAGIGFVRSSALRPCAPTLPHTLAARQTRRGEADGCDEDNHEA